MKRFITVISFAVLFAALPLYKAQATSPCMGQTEEEFQVTINDSSLIIHGAVKSAGLLKKGTSIKVLKVLKGEETRKTVFIKGWKHQNMPLFNYQKGDELIFLLTKKDGDYVLTDDNWDTCVPSLHKMREGLVYDSQTHERISVEDFAARYTQ